MWFTILLLQHMHVRKITAERNAMMMKPWNAAVYVRTSKSVEDDPGNTLGVQLGIIMDYLNKEEDIELYSVKIDNGCTGLNFAGVR